MKTQCLSVLATLVIGFIALTASAAEQALFDFTEDFDASKIAATDASVSATGSGAKAGLRVATGHSQPWPGITLPAPKGQWDLSPYAQVALTITNPGTNPVTVFCRVDNLGADGTDHCVTHSLALQPGQHGNLSVPLSRTAGDTLGGKLFGMRGYPAGPGGPGSVDPRRITQLVVFVSKPSADHLFDIRDIRAAGNYEAPTASITDADPFFPFIDTFGQYRHKDWPGKVKSVDDLKARREAETKELARLPGPKDWDKFGGWAAGPQLRATGFFRTEKVKAKWWLVDPEGRLFFSHGIDCVRMLDTTPIDERASWFADFPGDQPEFAAFHSRGSALKGHYAGRTPECFSFAGANLLRKYGADWRTAYPQLLHQRLRSWGLNTIGNWSDSATYRLRLTPYTDTIGSGRAKPIEGSEGYWGKFPDVFDPGFADGLRRAMEGKRNDSAGDPWCIGYFSDNEMSWGNDTSLALAALQSPPGQSANGQSERQHPKQHYSIQTLPAHYFF